MHPAPGIFLVFVLIYRIEFVRTHESVELNASPAQDKHDEKGLKPTS